MLADAPTTTLYHFVGADSVEERVLLARDAAAAHAAGADALTPELLLELLQ